MSRRILLPLLLAVLVGAVALVAVRSRTDRTADGDRLTADVRQALTLRVREAVEGGASPYLGSGLACAVRVLGTEPPAVERADRATTAYVWVVCGEARSPTETSLPLAVHFTVPPVAEAPGDGSANAPDKARIFPARLGELVASGPDDVGVLVAEMDRRRRELRGNALATGGARPGTPG